MKKRIFTWLTLIGVCSVGSVYAEERGLSRADREQISAEDSSIGHFRALVIGNNQYRDEEGTWRSLNTAANDAIAMAEVLKTDYRFSDVQLLLDADRKTILSAFEDLHKRLTPNDSVLVYYAGHGFMDAARNRGFWIPTDAKGLDSSTYIRNSTVRDELAAIAEVAKHTLLISDSCFSGSLLRGGNRGISRIDEPERYYTKVINKKSVQVIAAGGLEFVDDSFKESGHSPFSYFLINELKSNVNELMSLSELATRVAKIVANNVDQTPEIGVLQGAGDELGEFVFAKREITSLLQLDNVDGKTKPIVIYREQRDEYYPTIIDSYIPLPVL